MRDVLRVFNESIRTGTTKHHQSDSAAVQYCLLRIAVHKRSDVSFGAPLEAEPRWGTSLVCGCWSLRGVERCCNSAYDDGTDMGQQQQQNNKNKTNKKPGSSGSVVDTIRVTILHECHSRLVDS